jgi:hypothetical protein
MLRYFFTPCKRTLASAGVKQCGMYSCSCTMVNGTRCRMASLIARRQAVVSAFSCAMGRPPRQWLASLGFLLSSWALVSRPNSVRSYLGTWGAWRICCGVPGSWIRYLTCASISGISSRPRHAAQNRSPWSLRSVVLTSNGGLFSITVNSTTYSAYTSVAANRRLKDLPQISQYLRSTTSAPGGIACSL